MRSRSVSARQANDSHAQVTTTQPSSDRQHWQAEASQDETVTAATINARRPIELLLLDRHTSATRCISYSYSTPSFPLASSFVHRWEPAQATPLLAATRQPPRLAPPDPPHPHGETDPPSPAPCSGTVAIFRPHIPPRPPRALVPPRSPGAPSATRRRLPSHRGRAAPGRPAEALISRPDSARQGARGRAPAERAPSPPAPPAVLAGTKLGIQVMW